MKFKNRTFFIIGYFILSGCSKNSAKFESASTIATDKMGAGYNASAYMELESNENARSLDPTALTESETNNPLLEQLSEEQERILFLSATALLGEAKVDIYQMVGAYKEEVFDKSLSQISESGSGINTGPGNLDWLKDNSGIEASADQGKADQKLRQAIQWIVGVTDSLARINSLAAKLPDVDSFNLPLVEEALFILDKISPKTDLVAYRMYARLILIKAQIKDILPFIKQFSENICDSSLNEFTREIEYTLTLSLDAASDVAFIMQKKGQDTSTIEAFLTSSRSLIETLDSDENQILNSSLTLADLSASLKGKCKDSPYITALPQLLTSLLSRFQ